MGKRNEALCVTAPPLSCLLCDTARITHFELINGSVGCVKRRRVSGQSGSVVCRCRSPGLRDCTVQTSVGLIALCTVLHACSAVHWPIPHCMLLCADSLLLAWAMVIGPKNGAMQCRRCSAQTPAKNRCADCKLPPKQNHSKAQCATAPLPSGYASLNHCFSSVLPDCEPQLILIIIELIAGTFMAKEMV